jgi:hypothetical protein
MPFRVVGAPWVRAGRVAEVFNRMAAGDVARGDAVAGDAVAGDAVAGDGAPGVVARPVEFVPAEGKYAGQGCNGVMLHVTDRSAFRPVETGWLLLAVIRELHPGGAGGRGAEGFTGSRGSGGAEAGGSGGSTGGSAGGSAGRFEWAPYPTHVNPEGTRHLDLLLGVREAAALFDAGADPGAIRQWTQAGDWADRIRPFLLYP